MRGFTTIITAATLSVCYAGCDIPLNLGQDLFEEPDYILHWCNITYIECVEQAWSNYTSLLAWGGQQTIERKLPGFHYAAQGVTKLALLDSQDCLEESYECLEPVRETYPNNAMLEKFRAQLVDDKAYCDGKLEEINQKRITLLKRYMNLWDVTKDEVVSKLIDTLVAAWMETKEERFYKLLLFLEEHNVVVLDEAISRVENEQKKLCSNLDSQQTI